MKQKLNKVGHFCFLSASVDDPFYLAVNKTQWQWRTLASFSVVFELCGLQGVKRIMGPRGSLDRDCSLTVNKWLLEEGLRA